MVRGSQLGHEAWACKQCQLVRNACASMDAAEGTTDRLFRRGATKGLSSIAVAPWN